MRVSWELREDFYFGLGLIYNVKAGSMAVRINDFVCRWLQATGIY
jgi:hypothetical protein